MICCGAEEVFALDLAADAGPEGGPPRRWSWRAADSPEIPVESRPLFRTTDECKPFGPYVLVTASSGGVALIRRDDKACVFLARARNAHSACLLPAGRVAVAASTGGDEIVVFDRSAGHDLETAPIARLPLVGTHGVHWDAGRRRLWALGDDELLLVRVRDDDDGNAALTVDRRWPLPSPGGHDLAPAADGSMLRVTTNERVHLFDAFAFGFADDPVLGDEALVKSADRQGPSIVYHQATDEHWWSDTIRFADGTTPIRIPGARLYKVRWDVPNPLPRGH